MTAAFRPDLHAFLGDLADHNEREWFHANKSRYDTAVKEPALDFIGDFDRLCGDGAPFIHFLCDAVGVRF